MSTNEGVPDRGASDEQHEIVELHLTDTERIEFQKIAERCGLSLSAWILDRLREVARREAKEA